MAFMVPVYTNEPFAEVTEPICKETYLRPCDGMTLDETANMVGEYSGKWFARLSAPGYMDCTDWSGPFETLEEAKEHIETTYDVDPETGDELSDA